MPITWNPTQARYRDSHTGRFISRETVLGYVRESIVASGNVTQTLAQQVAGGQLSSREFLTVFKTEVKDEYIRQYIAGRGGLGSMTQSDWGTVGQMLKTQYAYASGFAGEIGNLSEAQIVNRANMYIESANQAFEAGYRKAIVTSGNFTEERWMLGDKLHCSGCIENAGRGWVPIGELPPFGSTPCGVRCGCHIAYR